MTTERANRDRTDAGTDALRASPPADAADDVDRAFVAAVGAMAPAARAAPSLADDLDRPVRAGTRLSVRRALALFDAQLESRHVDFAARWLRARQAGYYTIGSSGHEGNAAVAAALALTDPAFLHYRSGAFFIERARQAPGQQAARDMLLGMVAARDEPIAGGRHKVFGSAALHIPPQTSTIASHLPKAVGTAFALERNRRLRVADHHPDDAIVMCSFGDASVNHSTAVGAINAACRIALHWPMPVLFVCEDNGIGISVPTPAGWIERAYGDRPGLRYLAADGLDLVAAWDAAHETVRHVRSQRRPAFLHLRTVRLMGHAGSDVEIAYRSRDEIGADIARDPLVATARLLVDAGALTADQVLARYEATRRAIAALAEDAARRPRLESAAEIMAPLAPRTADAVAAEVARPTDAAVRGRIWSGRLPEEARPAPLVHHINAALVDLLAKYPELLVFGEDVGKKGGVYGVTRGLQDRVGAARVFDTLLDEQTILGLAIGAAHVGFLPVPEIQYLAYVHNAIDQLRGEAASLQFFSRGQFKNPMVVRIAAFAYQKGFGGHFHNDNAIAALRESPGLVIAAPGRGDDAAAMLRTCVAAARVDGAVCAYLEPIALYGERDLHDGDGGFAMTYDPVGRHVPLGSARVHGDGRDLLIVSYANGVRMSLRAAARVERSHGVRARVLDLRWIAPLPVADLLREATAVGRVLVVDEGRRTGGVSEGVITALVDAGYTGSMRRVAAADTFIPLGDAANLVLVSEAEIEAAIVGTAWAPANQ